ncbi:MAG TPA: hypothetical protein PKI93_05275 [Alphaproteobacteria bacterium]|nr:hypothetical protein [Alphaproteobacteria bacterium]HNS43724.1 hypothetical protein [Alphaproteobacteria bacterium]
MIFRINTTLSLTVSVVALSLTACAPQGPNQWMPKGYTYQDNTPLSSPAPSSPWLKEAEIKDTEKLAASTAAWQGATFELIDGLSAVLPSDGSPINVETVAPVTNQDLALDHYTRQALMQKNMTLTTTKGIGLTMKLNVEPLSKPEIIERAKKMEGFEYIGTANIKDAYMLCARLMSADGSELGKSHTIGIFPHEKLEYSRLPGYTTQPTTGITNAPAPVYESR